jgi:Protein of unknown function (DUF3530)
MPTVGLRLGGFTLAVLLLVSIARNATAQTAREQALAAALGPHTAVWLDAGGERFLAALQPSTLATPKGGVLIVHGLGGHLDWPQVIHPLRIGLARDGWITLSLQMPPDEDFAISKRIAARIQSGIAWLARNGVKQPVLLGYGAAARALVPIASAQPGAVRALVLVSPPPLATGDTREDQALKAIKCPLLEVVGSRDREEVLRAVAAHGQGADKTRYRLIVIDSAGYDYRDQGPALVKRVRGWLDHIAKPAGAG